MAMPAPVQRFSTSPVTLQLRTSQSPMLLLAVTRDPSISMIGFPA